MFPATEPRDCAPIALLTCSVTRHVKAAPARAPSSPSAKAKGPQPVNRSGFHAQVRRTRDDGRDYPGRVRTHPDYTAADALGSFHGHRWTTRDGWRPHPPRDGILTRPSEPTFWRPASAGSHGVRALTTARLKKGRVDPRAHRAEDTDLRPEDRVLLRMRVRVALLASRARSISPSRSTSLNC